MAAAGGPLFLSHLRRLGRFVTDRRAFSERLLNWSGFVSGAVFRFARGRVQLLSSLLLLRSYPPTSNKVHDFFLNTL